jgi:glycerophosphoryl diester phosphodiesterase
LFDHFTIIGHRGAAGLAPENTVLGIRTALQHGVEWVEVDVQIVDKQLVVFHDDTLERTTNGAGFISDASFEYVRQLDAGQKERVPLLQEVLTECSGCLGLNIELKGEGTSEAVAKLLFEYQWPKEKVLLSSFYHRELSRFKFLNTQYPVGVIIAGEIREVPALVRDLEPVAIVNHYSFTTDEFIRDSLESNLAILCYTVNNQKIMMDLRQRGVNAIFTDRPDLVDHELRLQNLADC